MKLSFVGNCQASALAHFMRIGLPKWEIHHMPHLATFYGEFTEEQIAAEHAWADLVFFHVKHDHPQDYPTKNPKVPLSVWYQSAPFMMQIPQNMWNEYKEQGGTPEGAPLFDFDYRKRWDLCTIKMIHKELDEDVPDSLRMSDLMGQGKQHQLQLTHNHPTSLVFREWALRIIRYLGETPERMPSIDECIQNLNLAGLPCEESATSGAVKALGLKWGGRDIDDESGLGIARERMKS